MDKPLVSIIIPTHNRAHLIGETLDSILAQTYYNWECIIVDDGSNDNTEDVVDKYIKKDSRFSYYKRPADRAKGGNACRNYGFEMSAGEFINWFDDDDLMLKNFLEEKVNAFSLELDLVIASGYYTNEFLKNKSIISLDEQSNLFKEYCLWKLQILTPSILFRKSFLLGKELFSHRISRGQETEFFSRIFFKLPKMQFKIINIPLFLYRQHADSKTYQNKLYNNDFKFSQSFIAIENFKKSIELEDYQLINYYYQAVLDCFFRALENNDKKNTRYILQEFIPILKKINYLSGLEFAFLGKSFCLMSRGSYRIEKYLKNKYIL